MKDWLSLKKNYPRFWREYFLSTTQGPSEDFLEKIVGAQFDSASVLDKLEYFDKMRMVIEVGEHKPGLWTGVVFWLGYDILSIKGCTGRTQIYEYGLDQMMKYREKYLEMQEPFLCQDRNIEVGEALINILPKEDFPYSVKETVKFNRRNFDRHKGKYFIHPKDAEEYQNLLFKAKNPPTPSWDPRSTPDQKSPTP